MGYAPLMFSILFFTAFAVYLFFGIYIICINPKASLNKMFLAVCSALCLWSFGFSMANSASSYEVCLFWRRVSALGWASIYSILLHFLLLLTGRGNALKRWWINLPIHIPALINIYVFSISGKMAAQQYNLVMKDFGWINVAVNNGWDIFFCVYYIGYIFVILGLVWDWRQKATDESTRKQASLIFISFLTALLTGSLTDVILSSVPGNPLPQMAPVFTLIPVAAIYYSIKRYDLMRLEPENKDEIILNDETRSKLFHYLSIPYLSGGLLYFFCEYLLHMFDGSEDFESAFLSSGLMFGTGFLILMVQRLKNEQMKYFLSAAIILASIPLITLRFLPYGSITVWAFPVILIIIFLLFNKHRMLVAVTVMAVAAQILLCLFKPAVNVTVNQYDYILRIGVFVIALLAG